MGRMGIRYRLSDGTILAVVSVARPEDLALNYNRLTEGIIEAAPDHPAIAEIAAWKTVSGALVPKTPAEIAADAPKPAPEDPRRAALRTAASTALSDRSLPPSLAALVEALRDYLTG